MQSALGILSPAHGKHCRSSELQKVRRSGTDPPPPPPARRPHHVPRPLPGRSFDAFARLSTPTCAFPSDTGSIRLASPPPGPTTRTPPTSFPAPQALQSRGGRGGGAGGHAANLPPGRPGSAVPVLCPLSLHFRTGRRVRPPSSAKPGGEGVALEAGARPSHRGAGRPGLWTSCSRTGVPWPRAQAPVSEGTQGLPSGGDPAPTPSPVDDVQPVQELQGVQHLAQHVVHPLGREREAQPVGAAGSRAGAPTAAHPGPGSETPPGGQQDQPGCARPHQPRAPTPHSCPHQGTPGAPRPWAPTPPVPVGLVGSREGEVLSACWGSALCHYNKEPGQRTFWKQSASETSAAPGQRLSDRVPGVPRWGVSERPSGQDPRLPARPQLRPAQQLGFWGHSDRRGPTSPGSRPREPLRTERVRAPLNTVPGAHPRASGWAEAGCGF